MEEWQRQMRCGPNVKFWRPLVSGISFPDCKSIEVHHWWASPPPTGTSILGQAASTNYFPHYPSRPESLGFSILEQAVGTNYFPRYPSRPESLGLLDGLTKLERISLEKPPELDTTILVQLLGHQNPLASNLTHLELRFCNLDPAVIAKLLQQASQSLAHLTLLFGAMADTSDYDGEEPPHLCPLIRDFCKNLVCLEYAAPTICTELFFNDDELQEIRNNCGKIDSERSDSYAVHQTVLDCRRLKRTEYRAERIQKVLREAGKTSDARIETSTELLLDREEEARERLITSSKSKWKRKIISWRGTCGGGPWSELEQGADLAETGLEWTLLGWASASMFFPRTLPLDVL